MRPRFLPFFLAALPLAIRPPRASAQQGDPFVKDRTPAPALAPGDDTNLLPEGLVRLEVFTLSLADARRVMRQFPRQADLYAWLGAELEKETPLAKLERLTVLRVRGGQRAELREVNEYAYPTEFDPARIPQSFGTGVPAASSTSGTLTPAPAPTPPTPAPATDTPGAKGDPGPSGGLAPGPPHPPGSSPAGTVFPPWPYKPMMCNAFQIRNTGWTTELEMIFSADGRMADVHVAPEFVRFCGMESQSPSGEMEQPIFEMSKLATQIAVRINVPTLAGTFSPPVSTGTTGENTANTTRLLFITVTDPR